MEQQMTFWWEIIKLLITLLVSVTSIYFSVKTLVEKYFVNQDKENQFTNEKILSLQNEIITLRNTLLELQQQVTSLQNIEYATIIKNIQVVESELVQLRESEQARNRTQEETNKLLANLLSSVTVIQTKVKNGRKSSNPTTGTDS
jgi:hypothetical protein